MSHKLQEILKIQHPVIMATMFLVSNVAMSLAAIEASIAPCIPALNYRSIEEFKSALDKLAATAKSYGINLIVNKSNIKLKDNEKNCSYFINDATHIMCVSSKRGSGSKNTRQNSECCLTPRRRKC